MMKEKINQKRNRKNHTAGNAGKKMRMLLCLPCAAILLLASCGKQQDGSTAPPEDVQTESSTAQAPAQTPASGGPASFSEFIGIDVRCAPSGIEAMPDGSLLVADTFGKRLWRIQEGEAAVYAGEETASGLYGEPVGGYRDAELQSSYFGRLWDIAPFLDGWAVSDMDNNVIRIVREGGVKTLGIRSEGAFGDIVLNRPAGLAADPEGNLYIADAGSGTVYRVTPQGAATKVAEGLSNPMGLCYQGGALYIAESGANRILKAEGGSTGAVAGSGQEGLEDGPAQKAAFAGPGDVAVGEDGTIYVADTLNSAIRRIRNGQVDTVLLRDLSEADLSLVSPSGLLLQEGRLYICDNFSRKLYVMDWN